MREICISEILFAQIRQNKTIKAFKIRDIETRLTTLADDTIFIVRQNLKYHMNVVFPSVHMCLSI